MKTVTLLWNEGIIGKPILTAKCVRMTTSVTLGERTVTPRADTSPRSADECVVTLELEGHVLPNNLFKAEIRHYLHTVVVGEGVTVINDGAFQNFTGLTTAVLPDGLVTIGKRLFIGCTQLNRLHIPDSVTTIGAEAFKGCTSLGHLVIPDSVSMIDRQAFMDCTSITNALIGAGIRTVGAEAFAGCSALENIRLGRSLRELGSAVFRDCIRLTHPTLPDTLRTLPGKAFFGCYNIRTAVLPEGIIDIGPDAYAYCTALQEITLPSTLKSVSTRAFSKCLELRSVTSLSVQAPTVGKYLFSKNRRRGFLHVPAASEGYAEWQPVLPVRWSIRKTDAVEQQQPEPRPYNITAEDFPMDMVSDTPVRYESADTVSRTMEEGLSAYDTYLGHCHKLEERYTPFFPWMKRLQIRYAEGVGWLMVVFEKDSNRYFRCLLDDLGEPHSPVAADEFLRLCKPELNRHLG